MPTEPNYFNKLIPNREDLGKCLLVQDFRKLYEVINPQKFEKVSKYSSPKYKILKVFKFRKQYSVNF